MELEAAKNNIFEYLKHQIVHLHVKPNQRLTEAKLSAHFECSRTPVREALRRLEQEGWVVMIPNQGYYVRSFTVKEIGDMFEVLVTLEKMAVRLASGQPDRTGLLRLRDKWVTMPQTWEETVGLYMIADDEAFHEAVAAASGNHFLHQQIQRTNQQIHIIRRIDYNRKDWAQSIVQDHLKLLDCMLEGRAEEAERAMETHIRSGKENLQHLIQLYLNEQPAFI
ncbi:GntR family transcriptional regulator [Paenibacillus humicola]|uniref:GntR family transcriptional regulator n=1 Tax=Paenibacillus humicola TaxID=3110540 RepID=UPI00237A7AF1|nr:GntR family transcriptional regulator [Paenibacillus humicola]